jgi:hypothetical protein
MCTRLKNCGNQGSLKGYQIVDEDLKSLEFISENQFEIEGKL